MKDFWLTLLNIKKNDTDTCTYFGNILVGKKYICGQNFGDGGILFSPRNNNIFSLPNTYSKCYIVNFYHNKLFKKNY